MATIVEKTRIPKGNDEDFIELQQDFAAPGATSAMRLIGQICVTITGNSTLATIRVERASRLVTNPAGSNAHWAPADDDPIDLTINPSAGVPAMFYEEPTMGWWRVRVLDLSGGTLTVNISGVDA
ncbi:hypothetical protein [Sphingomonas sp.]|uniref:hypothetical protein n=1 Tax=Sphingomonas sp. TaxID=28214 RepID=UPI00307CFF27